MTIAPPRTAPRIGRIHGFRLLQPCRFYAYGCLLSLVLVLVILAAVTGEWRAPALAITALLFMVPGIEAAARSTVGPADVLRAARNANLF